MVVAIGIIALTIAVTVIGIVGLVFVAQDEMAANRRFNRRSPRRR